jgi:three-Cys-motif partner protein
MEMPKEYEGREHTWLKHCVLSGYVTAWAHKLGSTSRSRKAKLWYVDCFAGPWKAADTELRDTSIAIGLKALEAAAATWGDKGFNVDVAAVFVEKDPAAFAELRNYLDSREGAVETHPIHGEFGDSVERIEHLVGSDAAFIFVDPKGWKGVGMKYIARLLEKPQRDVLINVMFDHINRFKDDPRRFLREGIRDFFGVVEGEIRAGMDEEALLRLYRDNLKKLSGINYAADLSIPYPAKERTKLRLVVGGRHPEIVRLFRDVERKVVGGDASPVRTMAKLRREEQRTGQMALIPPTSPDTDSLYSVQHSQGLEQAKAKILQVLIDGGPLRYGDLWPQILESFHITESDLKALIKDLEAAKKLTVENRGQGERSIKDSFRLSAGEQ